MSIAQLTGVVLKNYNKFYYVQDSSLNIYECKPRGKLKDFILSGDRVMFTPLEDGRGLLESILPRVNQLYRPKVANVDTVLIVMAHTKPAPDLMLLDRLLFLVAYSRMEAYIVLNKCDLPLDETVRKIQNYYGRHGFTLFNTSVTNRTGIEQLLQAIAGKVAVFAGPSGVGKSSLLNAMLDSALVKTGDLSEKVGRGKHTTRHVELFPLTNGAVMVDTPGFSSLDLPRLRREELGDYYPDFQDYSTECRFGNCLHHREIECGVKQAVRDREIADFRYNNYIHILEEVIANERCYR
ncbi:MAG TPA: ribosome small subunit-dependent GTPase A [Syntrophomonas sp.]|jgi:ribosome biogenesis GTPase|nr:ribosome small subunit-dependent GTPase A [Syntrophomonas sp.]